MKPSTFLILFPSLLLAAAIEAPVEGYDVFEPQWEVEVSPGGPVVVLNGTAEEVHEELLAMNPNWDSDFPIDLPEDTDGRSTLERRTDFSGAKVECWDQRVDSSEIRTGERYLRGLTGRPTNKAGPGTCGRVSCSWNSAIWWCNDVSSTILHFISMKGRLRRYTGKAKQDLRVLW